jgi:hypothetical protein
MARTRPNGSQSHGIQVFLTLFSSEPKMKFMERAVALSVSVFRAKIRPIEDDTCVGLTRYCGERPSPSGHDGSVIPPVLFSRNSCGLRFVMIFETMLDVQQLANKGHNYRIQEKSNE